MISSALIPLQVTRLLLAFTAIGSGIGGAESFRISQVVIQAGEGVEEMNYINGGHEEKLFVKKEAVVTEKDVEFAWVDTRKEISIRFNEEGAAKMKAVTSSMVPSHDRMAMLVDGKVVSAPVVTTVPLGPEMIITGMEALDRETLRGWADKMRGYHLQFLEDASRAKFPERPGAKYVEYTEEEYQELKQFREKRGYYYLDKAPTEEELAQSLHPGMSREEVTKIFGQPQFTSDRRMTYELAPEKRPADDAGGKMYPSGFSVVLAEGRVESWEHRASNARRNLKPAPLVGSILTQALRSKDFFKPDFNPAVHFEAIKIPDASLAAVEPADFKEIAMVVQLYAQCAEGRPVAEGDIDPACDMAVLLARHFPEVAALKKEAGEGKLSLRRLRRAVAPYADGKKESPNPAPKVDEEAPPGQ